jgi:hypothetical protein
MRISDFFRYHRYSQLAEVDLRWFKYCLSIFIKWVFTHNSWNAVKELDYFWSKLRYMVWQSLQGRLVSGKNVKYPSLHQGASHVLAGCGWGIAWFTSQLQIASRFASRFRGLSDLPLWMMSMSRQGHPIFDERMKQRWLSWDRAKLPRLLDANADQYLYGWTKFRSWSRPALACLGGPPWHNDISCDISSPSLGWKSEYAGMDSIFLLHHTASSSGYTALHLKVCTISEAHSHSTAPRATLLIWQARSCQVLQVAQDNIFKISTYHPSKS